MTGAAAPIRIEAGALLVFDQEDYLYGTGKLRIRVPRGGVVPPGVEWLPLAGTEIGQEGEPLGQRHAVIRVDALPEALRAGEACTRRHQRRSVG